MYKMSEADDKVIQRVVTNEIAVGILNTFCREAVVKDLHLNDEDLETLNRIFVTESNNESLHGLNKETLRVIADKIEKMYAELLDDEYEYIYDEFGEYLIYLFMKYTGAEEGSGDIDLHYFSNQLIQSSLYVKDELYLREWFGNAYDRIAEDFPEELEGVSREWYISTRIRNVSVFPYLGYEDPSGSDNYGLFNDDSFIFWDEDHMFYDKECGANIFVQNLNMGFTSDVDPDDREPVSGSMKEKIKGE